MKSDLQFDYAAVGHVTIDVFEDGSCGAGGTALFGALQAARLGLRALIVTQGVPAEIERLLAPYRDELELQVLPAAQTTTLLTAGSGAARRQRVLAWAGAMPDRVQTRASILHLAPVAQETPSGWDERPQLVGLTPQGLARQWRGPDRDFVLEAPGPDAEGLAGRCDALVLSEAERDSCQGLIDSATAAGASVAVTAGERHTTVLWSGNSVSLAAPTVERALDDVGAGDVFAAAFFVALAEGRTPPDAGAFANAAAAVRIRGCGPDAVAGRARIDAQLAR